MLTADGVCRIGAPAGPISSSMARVSAKASESGISSQRKRGLPMSTVNRPPSPRQHGMRPACVSKVSARAAGLLADQSGDAAHAVAAGASFGTVIVVDANKTVRRRTRRIEHHELIVRLLPRRGLRFGGRDRLRRLHPLMRASRR